MSKINNLDYVALSILSDKDLVLVYKDYLSSQDHEVDTTRLQVEALERFMLNLNAKVLPNHDYKVKHKCYYGFEYIDPYTGKITTISLCEAVGLYNQTRKFNSLSAWGISGCYTAYMNSGVELNFSTTAVDYAFEKQILDIVSLQRHKKTKELKVQKNVVKFLEDKYEGKP